MVDSGEEEKEVAITAKMTKKQKKFLDEYAEKHHGNNRSRALREIINFFKRKKGLEGKIEMNHSIEESKPDKAVEEINDYFETIITALEEHDKDIEVLRSKVDEKIESEDTPTKEPVRENKEETSKEKKDIDDYKEDMPSKIENLIKKMDKEDLPKGGKTTEMEKSKKLTTKAVKWLKKHEKGTMKDIIESIDVEKKDWNNYIYPPLAYLAEKTKDDDKNYIVNPGNEGHWWWLIEDENTIDYPFSDFEKLPKHLLEKMEEEMRPDSESSLRTYIGKESGHELVEEILRVLRHIQETEKTKKSIIIDEVYSPYTNLKESSWWKLVRGLLKEKVEKNLGYIKLGKTIEWTGEPL